MKAYTDLEQSKKLATFLPIESADMVYLRCDFEDEGEYSILVGSYHEGYAEREDGTIVPVFDEHIPCWSLGALLDVLPLGLYDECDDRDYELEINMIDKMPRYVRLGDVYHSEFPYDFEKDTLLDNIVESIIWLNDNNYFEL